MAIEFVNVSEGMKYFNEVLAIAIEQYEHECKYVKEIGGITQQCILQELQELFKKGDGLVYIQDGKVQGYLIYKYKWHNNDSTSCMFPFIGYGASVGNRVNIISRLFQALADKLCKQGKVNFQVNLYAHDDEIIRLFSFLQFGIQCEEGICNVNIDVKDNGISKIEELSKNEITKCWSDIWSLLDRLVNHLRKSPVFYPGTEFTEDVYKNYMLDENTRLFAAKVEGNIVGIITASKDGNSFINSDTDFYNVGDVYVIPEYRGKMVAQSMLKVLSDTLMKERITKLWVEHGTANPNARGFWNKYFHTYSYLMIRTVEC